tara:strand:- start:2900 stop:3778 length:879 start_codon:yes stop_codon:yes gene_type:complete
VNKTLSEWLHLRENTDAQARSMSLTKSVASKLSSDQPVHILDLATGTGSNIRHLIEHLPTRQQWLVTDKDQQLLAELPTQTERWCQTQGYKFQRTKFGYVILGTHLECHIETQTLNLSNLDSAKLFHGHHLVTASALLDLVSASWLRTLINHCHAVGAAILFTITYNGSVSCSPAEHEDEQILKLFNLHQQTDKGLGGRAEGPNAITCAIDCFSEVGYQVQRESSNWTLGTKDQEIQRQLITGWGKAVKEIAPETTSMIKSWETRRLAHVDANRSKIIVGHDDIAALPTEKT